MASGIAWIPSSSDGTIAGRMIRRMRRTPSAGTARDVEQQRIDLTHRRCGI